MRGDMGLGTGAGLTVAWARRGASGWLGDLGLTVLACGFTRGTGSVIKPDMTETSYKQSEPLGFATNVNCAY